MDYSTAKISSQLLDEIKNQLCELDWGSIEIFVQNSTVVQITRRQIKKTTGENHKMNGRKFGIDKQ